MLSEHWTPNTQDIPECLKSVRLAYFCSNMIKVYQTGQSTLISVRSKMQVYIIYIMYIYIYIMYIIYICILYICICICVYTFIYSICFSLRIDFKVVRMYLGTACVLLPRLMPLRISLRGCTAALAYADPDNPPVTSQAWLTPCSVNG